MDELLAHVDTLDSIPEDATVKVRDLYAEAEGGGFRPKVKSIGGVALEDVGGLRRALEDLEGKATSRKRELDQYTVDGERVTPQQISDWRRKADKFESAPNAQDIRSEVETEWKSRAEEQASKFQTDLASKDRDINELVVTNGIVSRVGDKGNGVLLAELAQRDGAKPYRDENGEWRIRFVRQTQDGAEVARRSHNDATKDMSVDEWLERSKTTDDPRYRGLWFGTGKGGGGSEPVEGGGGSGNVLRVPFAKAGSKEVQKARAEGKKVEFID